MRIFRAFLMFVARICLVAVFFVAGISKFISYDATVQYMTAKALPAVPLLLVLAAILEIGCSLLILLGYKTRLAATLLWLYLIPTTLIFHAFWMSTDPADIAAQQINFFKNLSIFGGLMYVICFGAGLWAFDREPKHQPLPPAEPKPQEKV